MAFEIESKSWHTFFEVTHVPLAGAAGGVERGGLAGRLFGGVLLRHGWLERAADILTVIPDTAQAVVLVNHLDAASNKFAALAGKVGGPPIPLLMLARLQTGIQAGLDDKGPGAFALLPVEGKSPAPIVVLSVSDYAQLLAPLKPKDAKAKIAEITVAGQPALACQKGDFALLTTAEYKGVLEEVLAAKKSVAEENRAAGQLAGEGRRGPGRSAGRHETVGRVGHGSAGTAGGRRRTARRPWPGRSAAHAGGIPAAAWTGERRTADGGGRRAD